MSTLEIQERFTLEAPPDVVWARLLDPEQMVSCLPGAELTGREDERTYTGAVKVRVGSVTVSYRGKITFEEVDPEERHLRLLGKGNEKSGSGSATMTMDGRVRPNAGGGSEVTVDAHIRLTGRIVRFGRGMIETVSAEIFKEFRTRLAESLTEAAVSGPESAAPGPTGSGGAEPAPSAAERRRSDDALALIPLLARALRSWLRRLFGRG